MHKLLCLSKETRDTLTKALANSELFLNQVPPHAKIECQYCHCHQVLGLPSITFTPEDMLVKNSNRDRLLYYTGYIGSTKLERVLINPDSTYSIIPVCLLQFLHIPIWKLALTTTTIYGFNIQSSQHVGKIYLKCQIGNLKTEWLATSSM